MTFQKVPLFARYGKRVLYHSNVNRSNEDKHIRLYKKAQPPFRLCRLETSVVVP